MPSEVVNAKFWQNLVMLLICLSFIYANLSDGPAHDLWSNSPESMILFLTAGVGLKMGKDVLDRAVTMKYGAGSARIANPDKGI